MIKMKQYQSMHINCNKKRNSSSIMPSLLKKDSKVSPLSSPIVAIRKRMNEKEVAMRLRNWQTKAREHPAQAKQPYEWSLENVKPVSAKRKKQVIIKA